MTEDWERITALFGAARLLDPDARAAFLDAACEDARLRVEVVRLLADSECQDDFLAEPAWPELFSLAALTSSVRPGDVIKGRYRIEETVASGGQALVYRAIDTVLSRQVIVKVMRATGPQKQRLKSAFEHERQALSHIDHPGVIGIFDVGELADGRPFLVIQYVNGVSLREELQKGQLELTRAARLLRELASALGAAHAAGVAHRDLKPENIMLQRFEDGGETLKLIDFGISRAYGAPTASSVVVAGTVRYMAPEQFQGADSPASDVYALALVVCEMLCGHPDSRALPKSVSGATKRLIEAALAFRPEDRPRDARRWCEQLATALITGGRSRIRQAWAIAAAAVIAVMIAALAARAHWTPAPPAEANRFAVSRSDRPSAADRTPPSRPKNAAIPETVPESLTGEWTISGILTVCGVMCGSPVGTIYQSVARFTQDTETTFHGTYFGYPVTGTLSGSSVVFGFDHLQFPPFTLRRDCAGTIAGAVMTLKCNEYVRPAPGSEFQLNGTRTDTVVRR